MQNQCSFLFPWRENSQILKLLPNFTSIDKTQSLSKQNNLKNISNYSPISVCLGTGLKSNKFRNNLSICIWKALLLNCFSMQSFIFLIYNSLQRDLLAELLLIMNFTICYWRNILNFQQKIGLWARILLVWFRKQPLRESWTNYKLL